MNPKNLLDRYGLKPDFLLDQHFMLDQGIINKIVSLAEIKPGDKILEIGAGIGTLTKVLAGKGGKVTAVELDKKLEPIISEETKKFRNVKIVYGNVLEIINGMNFNKIVSNTPYSICEPLFNKMIRKKFDLAVLSVPESFSDILFSKPRDKKFSVISLKSQSFFRINFEFSIPGKAFYPEPKTRSVVITTEPLSVKDYEKCPEKYVLKEIFLQSKKKLKNALTEGIINLNKNILSRDFTKNMARETIKKMKLKGGMLDKGVEKIRTADFENLLEKLSLL